jgi:hypothetical protein
VIRKKVVGSEGFEALLPGSSLFKKLNGYDG